MYNLPIGFLSEKVLTNIGNYIREFQSSDPNNFMGVWRNYMRIRVSIDVRKPLKQRLRLKNEGGEWFWVEFKYERLNTFCFICGLLGHTEKLCPKLYDCVDAELVRPYGPEMKAPTHRNAMSAGERWLRSAPPEDFVLNFGSSTDSVRGTYLNAKNASKSGVAKNANILNISGIDGCELMESMVQSKKLPVAKAIDSQRVDKGKEVALFENGLGFTQVVESYKEKGIILKEAKR